MAPILDWKKLMKVDPDALPRQEELAERLLESMSKVFKGKTEHKSFVIHSSLNCLWFFAYINDLFCGFCWCLYKNIVVSFLRLMGKT